MAIIEIYTNNFNIVTYGNEINIIVDVNAYTIRGKLLFIFFFKTSA